MEQGDEVFIPARRSRSGSFFVVIEVEPDRVLVRPKNRQGPKHWIALVEVAGSISRHDALVCGQEAKQPTEAV